jgi:hypothetical protein
VKKVDLKMAASAAGLARLSLLRVWQKSLHQLFVLIQPYVERKGSLVS